MRSRGVSSGSIMPEYQAYIMGPDGHVHYRIDLVCKDEAAAKKHAKALVDGFAVELWQLDRLIERFERKEVRSP
jgi:hypothetical protein